MTVPNTLTGTRANLPFVRQNPDWEACNVATTRKSVKECLGSAVDLRVLTTKRARQIMGVPSGGTSVAHTQKVFRHYGMVEGVDYVVVNFKPWAAPLGPRELLKAGWGVSLFIQYGYVNQMLPRFSGSPGFNGPHAVYLRHRWKLRRWRVGLHDPLHDGRRRSIPQGSVNAPQWLIRRAAEAYCLTKGAEERVYGYAVKRR